MVEQLFFGHETAAVPNEHAKGLESFFVKMAGRFSVDTLQFAFAHVQAEFAKFV